MPWSIVKGGGNCDDDEWAVINDDSGDTEGCHPTREAAEEQRRALYANEDDESEESAMWSIRESEAQWEVVSPDGAVLSAHATYQQALDALGREVAARLAELADDGDVSEDGLLPETWESADGVGFREETGDGRDFSECQFSWRDPEVSLLPLMLQTQTDIGHFGAELAGFIQELSMAGVAIQSAGRFYDSETGRGARDLLLGGRHFGVSMDPGHVTAEWECIEEDEDGWCIDAKVTFTEYEVIGLTMTPFPAFARAAISLRGEAGESSDGGQGGEAAVAASSALAIPVRPPAGWFQIPEPQPGQTGMIDVYGMPVEELLVEQRDGSLAVPLTILDDGRVFGHIARRGQPHQGNRQITTPVSAAAYAHFNVGEVVCDGGERVAAGAVVAGCDHALAQLRAPEARDHYAHNGLGWCDLRATEGEFGPWGCGALRPDVTDAQLRVLRAGALSGDWRRIGGELELICILAVNAPGFPVAREAVLASGLPMLADARARASLVDERVESLVASAIVTRCQECQRRALAEAAQLRGGPLTDRQRAALDHGGPTDKEWREAVEVLRVLERRTRHLVGPARDQIRERIRASA